MRLVQPGGVGRATTARGGEVNRRNRIVECQQVGDVGAGPTPFAGWGT